ncbi:putative Ig domain-containing protein [Puia dinghuensis]|uniref:Dystroglycan-type cadherin-like domain-containing protein n=1 Tax=Puia dinghuensis TaxID=1792502 RepID=A0A8J2UJ48_9BACT|nr:putative Ig domain-containing protein [Puia dinghuensis]GGB24259.1 hypothetical protein GCM10011511_55200 [Puia dinghuensis]
MVNLIQYLSFALFLLALPVQGSTQSVFWDSPEAYLGQARPSDTPRIFAPGLLTEPGHFNFTTGRIAFTPDGKEVYYAINTQWYSGKDLKLKYFIYDQMGWKGPRLLNAHYSTPTFSPDGSKLFLAGGGKAGVIWQSKRTDTGWSAPVEYLQRSYALYNFIETASGNRYVGSNGTWGKMQDMNAWDFSILSNTDTTIRSLGVPLNTPGFDGDFFIATDESFMVVSAKETKDNQCELYISYRKKDHSWTNPKSLGTLINDGPAHRWGEYVTPDNKYLFYTRGTSEKDCAIYWVRFDDLLDRFRHTNFEPYVKTPIADQAAQSGHPLHLTISPDVFVDDDGNHTLKISAALEDGSPLPDWLRFRASNRTFSGTPANPGSYHIRITATDTAGATVSTDFTLKVNG